MALPRPVTIFAEWRVHDVKHYRSVGTRPARDLPKGALGTLHSNTEYPQMLYLRLRVFSG